MFKHICIVITALFFCSNALRAQNASFITEGKIEFEKRFNIHSLLEGEEGDWIDDFKKRTPQFKTTYFDLSFHDNKTLYQPGREVPENQNNFWSMPAEENVVYSDLDSSQQVSQKKIYEETFLLKDSTRSIKWKITNETRTIAGFECRRANALIMDSIYVVAFYTDAIVTPGGPESFSGLPGMILGVALPHNHVTWFATKVTVQNTTAIKPPLKGKKTPVNGYQAIISDRVKSWGNEGKKIMFAAFL